MQIPPHCGRRHEPTARHPDMTLQEFGTCRAGHRIPVPASQLHLRSVPLRRRIIQSQLSELTRAAHRNLPDRDVQQPFGHLSCLAVHCLQKVVVLPIVSRHTGSTQPAGNRPATTSRQHSRHNSEHRIPPFPVQHAGENLTPLGYHCG